MRRGLILAVVLTLLVATPVLAASYSTPVTVTEDGTSGYVLLPVIVDIDNQDLADLNLMLSSGFDTRVLRGSTELTHMVADDKLLFLLSVTQGSQYPLEYTLGNDPLTCFPVIVGNGGYVTVSDAPALELATDFDIEFVGYLDASTPIYPIVEATATSTEDAEVNSHDVDLPSGIVEGNLLLVLFGADDPSSGGPDITWTSEWTELDQWGDSDFVAGVAYKVAEGDEGSTMIITTDVTVVSAHQTFRISGYHGLPSITAQATGSGTNPNSPSLTLDVETSTLWFTVFGGHDTVSTAITTYPTSYDDGQQFTESGTGYANVGSARKELVAATDDPGQYVLTQAQDNWAAWTVAVSNFGFQVTKEDSFQLYNDGGGVSVSLLNCGYYRYDEGSYEDDWSVGYSAGTGSQSKQSDHLYLQADDAAAVAERTWVTDTTIDFTDIDEVWIDWENTGASSSDQRSGLVVDNTQEHGIDNFEARIHNTNTFSRQVESLDVSGQTGAKYIRVHARDNIVGSAESELKVYRIWTSDSGVDLTVTASSVSLGDVVKAWADGTNFGIDIEGSTKDTTPLGRAIAADNTNDWIVSAPYLDYYKHTISDTLVVWYQPVTMISGTTLPDRQGAAQNGVITWGTNPSNISIAIGALLPVSTSSAETQATGDGSSFIPATGNTSMTMTGIEGENLPLYGFFAGLFNSYQAVGGPEIPMPFFWKMVAVFAGWCFGTAVLLTTRQVVFGFVAYVTGFAVPAFFMGGILDPWIPIVYGIAAACLAALIWRWTSSAIN